MPVRYGPTFAKLSHDATVPSAAGFRRRHSAPQNSMGSRGIAAIARPTRTAKTAMIASLMLSPGNPGNRGTGRGAGDSVPRLLSSRLWTASRLPCFGNACTLGHPARGMARGHDCLHPCGRGTRCVQSQSGARGANGACSLLVLIPARAIRQIG